MRGSMTGVTMGISVANAWNNPPTLEIDARAGSFLRGKCWTGTVVYGAVLYSALRCSTVRYYFKYLGCVFSCHGDLGALLPCVGFCVATSVPGSWLQGRKLALEARSDAMRCAAMRTEPHNVVRAATPCHENMKCLTTRWHGTTAPGQQDHGTWPRGTPTTIGSTALCCAVLYDASVLRSRPSRTPRAASMESSAIVECHLIISTPPILAVFFQLFARKTLQAVDPCG